METEKADIIAWLDNLEQEILIHREKVGLRPCTGCTKSFQVIREKVQKLGE